MAATERGGFLTRPLMHSNRLRNGQIFGNPGSRVGGWRPKKSENALSYMALLCPNMATFQVVLMNCSQSGSLCRTAAEYSMLNHFLPASAYLSGVRFTIHQTVERSTAAASARSASRAWMTLA